MEYTHPLLVIKAAKWLERQGYWPVLTEFVSTYCREIPDAIGWKSRWSTVVEVKASRADFLGEKKKKSFRLDPTLGIGYFRYFFSPENVVRETDLTGNLACWGLLWFDGRTVKTIRKAAAHENRNTAAELGMMLTALRRVQKRIEPLSLKAFLQAQGLQPMYMVRTGDVDPAFMLKNCIHGKVKDTFWGLWCMDCGSPLRREGNRMEVAS